MQIILLAKITKLHKKITVNHDTLVSSFANGTQRLKYWVLIANLIFISLIITAVTVHYTSLIKKLLYSKQKLKIQKEKLHTFIRDLEKTKENLSIEIIQHKKIIGTISHDIRSPLKYIQLIAEYLSNTTEKNGDLVSNKHASSIQKSAAQLYDFTKTLIHYSQIYIEDKNYQQKPYLVFDLIESKKSLFEEIALNNHTKIINVTNQNLNSDLNINIISIVIHNLLDNAVKNTHNGSIEVGAKFKNEKLTYWVKDSGSGMNEDIINYYMNLFNKKNSEKLILSTSGMGLHLVLELLILLKGKISFSSTDNIGTVVTIEV
jgi:K+-sensing histidine kinase KdpD